MMRHLPIPRAGFGGARAPVLSTLFLMCGLCAALTATAALPLHWRADWPNCKPVEKLLHRGVDVALQPTFYINGSLADTNGWAFSTFVQTNAVGAWFGPLPGAYFSHTNDVGAAFYNVMVRAETPGGSVNYTAFARFRMLDSPGFTPGELPLPAKMIDFADVTVLNPPWPSNVEGLATLEDLAAVAQDGTNYTEALQQAIIDGSVTAFSAIWAEGATFAANAGALEDGIGNNREAGTIFAQLDAATETNAAQSAALAAKASTNDVSLTPVGGGTWRTFRDGVEVTSQVGQPVYVSTSSGEWRWQVDDGFVPGDVSSDYDSYEVLAPEYAVSFSYFGMTAPEFTNQVHYTALRSVVGYFLGSQTNKVFVATNAVNELHKVLSAAVATNAQQSVQISALSTSLAPIPGQISTLGSQVNAIGAHLNAEDARFVSTNYNSETRMAEAYVEVQVSNSWLTVWREMTRWNWFLGIYTNQYAAIAAALADKGEKEYAFYDGVTGEPAPDGFFWISQPRIAIAAGMSYQSYVDSAGAVWVLESNGMIADLNGTTNGYFRISDDEGNSQFEIVKGTARTVGATAGAMTRTEVMGVTHWFTTYAVTNAASAPVAMYTRDLTSGEWFAETDADCPVNVSWTSPDPGVYVCEWWPKTTEPTMFMKAEYGQGTETRIRQVAPVEMQTIVVGGVKYTLGTATIDGVTVLTATRQ